MVKIPLLNHTATSTAGGNVSTVHTKKIKDTAVAPSQTGIIDRINRGNRIEAEKERDANNRALQQRLDYYKQ